jgi:hypothetical protein
VLECTDCKTLIDRPVLHPTLIALPLCLECATARQERGEFPVYMQPVSDGTVAAEFLPSVLSTLTDPDLLTRVGLSFQEVLYVNAGRKISPVSVHERPELWNNLVAAWNEAARRGYTVADLGGAIKSVGINTGYLKSLREQLGNPESWNPAPDLDDVTWKQFEQLLAKLHSLSADDCVVTVDEKVRDRTTNTPRQLDVTLRFRKSFYDFLVVIECRHQKASVTIGDVDAFAKKLEDVNGHRGVIVTSSDFDPGAIAKAAFYGIELRALSQSYELDWEEHVRETVRAIPFPDEVTFDPVEPGAFSTAPDGTAEMSFGEFRLTDHDGVEIETIASLIARLSLDILRNGVALPVRISVECDPPATLRVDRFNVAIPIKAVEVTFALETRTHTRSLRKAAVLRRYEYQNVATGDVRLLREKF